MRLETQYTRKSTYKLEYTLNVMQLLPAVN